MNNKQQNEHLIEDLSNIANLIIEQQFEGISPADALKIAVKVQENKFRKIANEQYCNAHVLWAGDSTPSALEMIGMQLKDLIPALYSIGENK